MQKYDAVVGDITMVANHSMYVDFSLPYTESGLSMVVLVKDDESKNLWIFLKPLSLNLWLTTGAAFIFTGLVVWVLEHRVNSGFRGPPKQQLGLIFWFSFSTLTFAHSKFSSTQEKAFREKYIKPSMWLLCKTKKAPKISNVTLNSTCPYLEMDFHIK